MPIRSYLQMAGIERRGHPRDKRRTVFRQAHKPQGCANPCVSCLTSRKSKLGEPLQLFTIILSYYFKVTNL